MQRGVSAADVVVVPTAAAHFPLRASLPSVFQLQLTWYGPVSRRAVTEPKRFSVSATIEIKGDLTAEELREIFLPAQRHGGRVTISEGRSQTPEPEPVEEETDEEAYKRVLSERVRNMLVAYEEKLGEPPEQLKPALGMWITEFGEDLIRKGMAATALAAIQGRQPRYEWLRAWLRGKRSAQRRER